MVNSKYDAYFLYYCVGRELYLTSRAKNLDVSCFFFYYYFSTPSLTKDCKSNSLVTFNNLSRPWSWCGYDGQFPLERTANMYECYSGLYFIIQPRCHTNVVCECSVYHNAGMSLARPLASKLINFEQPCTLIFSSPFPTSCRAWLSLHLWPWVRYVARRNLCVLDERKIMLSGSIVRSFCLNCLLCNNLRGQWFCFVVYEHRTFLSSILIKIQLDASVYRYLFTAESLYMFRVSLQIGTRVLIWPRWREVGLPILWPVPEAAVTVFSAPNDGCCDTRNM